jgi:hypothetical protein
MLGIRHQIRPLAGARLGLLSVFALMAFACFPALGAAVNCPGDSSAVEYCDAPPPEYEKTPKKNPATSQKTGGPGQSATSPGSIEESNSGRKSSTDESGGGGIPAHKDGGGKGGPGPQAEGGDKPQKQPVAIDATPTSTDDDGGSSPLAPILIALAVLAAISIGAVVMRRRRDPESGSPISPEAS